MCVHPSWGGQRPEQLLHSRDKSRSNSETKNLSFLAPLLSPLLFSLHQSALLGRVPHCLPQDQSLSPLPHWPGDSLTPKDAFAKMAALPL